MSSNIVETFKGCFHHKTQLLAAALTFYALLSLGPLLIIILTITSYILDNQTARIQLIGRLAFFVGQANATEIGQIIDGAATVRHKFMATSIGIVLLYSGASAVFNALHEAMNIIWEVPAGKRSTVLGFLRKQIVIGLLAVTISVFFLLSMMSSVLLAMVNKNSFVNIPLGVINIIDFTGSVLIYAFLFAFIYRIVPDVKNSWKNVRLGAIVTSIVFNCTKFLMSRLVSHSEMLLAYGRLASLIVIIIWVFISAHIILIGAEFTRAYNMKKQNSIKKNRNVSRLRSEN